MKHLGAIIRSGYLIVANPDDSEEAVFQRFVHAAAQGDTIARDALDDITLLTHQVTFLGEQCGINLIRDKHRVILSPRVWPKTFVGSCQDHLQRQAEEGNYIATMFLAWMMRQRITDPDFKLEDSTTHGNRQPFR